MSAYPAKVPRSFCLALVGHTKGEKVAVNAPKGKVTYLIDDIIK
jgi:transcription elongation GreA/GreB family factor